MIPVPARVSKARMDDDLRGLWRLYPAGRPGVERTGGVTYAPEEYGPGPWYFRVVTQNGSRARLRLVLPDGSDARWRPGGDFIERGSYTSDLRRGIYWEKAA